jgi:hypothetical protein
MWHALLTRLTPSPTHARAAVDAPGTPARHGSNATQSRATVESLIII